MWLEIYDVNVNNKNIEITWQFVIDNKQLGITFFVTRLLLFLFK